jgi:hypothetical protein
MNKENEAKLVKQFPGLYSDVGTTTPRESLMSFGFECETGWFQLLWDLSTELTAAIEAEPDWWAIKAAQVKEKYGTLRFYLVGSPDKLQDIVDKYEHLSAKTCELCAKPGRLCHHNGWLKTLCPDCAHDHRYTNDTYEQKEDAS